jgi:hypothetical protein
MIEQSDTPRSHAAGWSVGCSWGGYSGSVIVVNLSVAEDLERELTVMTAERDALSASNQALREALEFYYEKKHLCLNGVGDICDLDNGECARAALSQTPPQALAAQQERERRLKTACEAVSNHYCGSLDHQPPYVLLCRSALNPESEPK